MLTPLSTCPVLHPDRLLRGACHGGGSVAPGGRRSVPAPRMLSRVMSPRYHRGVWPPGVRAPVPSTRVRSFEGREDTPAAQRGLTDDEPREPVRAPRLTAAVPAAYGRRAVSAPPGAALRVRINSGYEWRWLCPRGDGLGSCLTEASVRTCFLFCSPPLSLQRVPFRLNFPNYSPLITVRAG